MDMTTRVQILDAADCISHCSNTFGTGMNSIILPLATERVWHKPFFDVTGCRALAQLRLVAQNIPKALSVGIPLKRDALGNKQKTQPFQGGLEPGRQPPETRGCQLRCTSTDCHRNQDTPDQIRVCPNTADRSVKWLGKVNRRVDGVLQPLFSSQFKRKKIQKSVSIQDIHGGGLISLQRCSRCILQPY